MGSSYTWCNSKEVTHFLDHWFLWDLMVKNSQLPHQQNLFKGIFFLSPYLLQQLISLSLFLSFFLSFSHPFYYNMSTFFFSRLIWYNFLLFHPSCYGDLWHNITVLHPVTCIAYSHTYIYILMLLGFI